MGWIDATGDVLGEEVAGASEDSTPTVVISENNICVHRKRRKSSAMRLSLLTTSTDFPPNP